MEKYLTTAYWMDFAQRIWEKLLTEINVAGTLTEVFSIVLCGILAKLAARALKRRLLVLLDQIPWKKVRESRLTEAFMRSLSAIIAMALVWFSLIAFHRFDAQAPVVRTAASLLTAWVVIRLGTSVVREANWARFIALIAWGLAALHILGLLEPTLDFMDRLAINLGGIRLSLLLLLKAVIILAFLIRLALSASVILEKRILTLEGITPSVQVLLVKALKVTLIFLAVVVSLSSLGINLSAFAFVGGAVGVGVGFGLQKVVSNLISGVILLMDKSIKPGDVIEVGGTYGRIQSLGARYVSVITRDSFEYLIPNEDLITQQVVNWSFSSTLVRLKIQVGVSYDSDVPEVMKLMVEAAGNVPRVLKNPKPVCQLKGFGDSSIDMELRIWIEDPENGVSNVKSAVRVAIWEIFRDNHVEIPFPQRDVTIKNSDG